MNLIQQYDSYIEACKARGLKPVSFSQHTYTDALYQRYRLWCSFWRISPADIEIYNRVNDGMVEKQ